MSLIRVGTRGSKLAVTQTEHVIASLLAHHPDIDFETVIIKTTGDQRADVPFATVGTKGMFVKELEEALLRREVDLAIHSMKDIPGVLGEGLTLVATPKREDPRDALVSRNGIRLGELPPRSRVGSSSLRRQILIRDARPDLDTMELRGNLDTRLRKLEAGDYDAIVVACAGLDRMGWGDQITERLSPDFFIPAPGQGALALETREDDISLAGILAAIHDVDTADAVAAERGFQARLNAGCSVPAGAFATVSGREIELAAFLARQDGSDLHRVVERGQREDASGVGARAADRLLAALNDET